MFMFFSFVVIFFRIIGINLGWGMQFQNPFFIIFIIILLLLFTIMSFDLININFLQKHLKINFLENKVFKKNIFVSNFFTGILSTLLATPCTAPLVGTAVSFALSQNYFFTIMIFFLMGLGKSSPYILFIIRPNILSNLPKPGSWTKYVKALVGALLILSLIWLSNLLLSQYFKKNLINNNTNQEDVKWEPFNKEQLINYLNEKVFLLILQQRVFKLQS